MKDKKRPKMESGRMINAAEVDDDIRVALGRGSTMQLGPTVIRRRL